MASKVGILVLLYAIGVCVCHPRRRFLDCDHMTACADVYAPVCGSDGNTYSSECSIGAENQKRMCWYGHYNMVAKMHDGACDPTTAAP
ncbi:ovoinhibitor-like [Mya arenaria]|uniref:ovoinhibitor-like n=1 Tax=Mya arenaria TaxID=6604 RepID=UPI0022E90A02|nr:ovoinhibitor-like [Mya arenaria]